MINIVYLVVLFNIGSSSGLESQSIMQANIKQCEINKKSIARDRYVYSAYCIVGVK